MPKKFKDLTVEQKKQLLRDEYLRDGASEETLDMGMIPEEPYLTDRLVWIFDYTDDTDVEIK